MSAQNEVWAKTVAQTILKTKSETAEHHRQMKEMKEQMLEYMERGSLSDFPMTESNKKLIAVDSPVRFSLEEAIRSKFSQDGVEASKIDDWLKEVKAIRRSGIKSTRRIMKIAQIRKEKATKAKGVAKPQAALGKRAKVKVRFANETKETVEKGIDEPNAPMHKVA